MKWIFWSGLLTIVATACVAENASLDPADYDRRCTEKEECVIVPVGNMCDATCDEAAISLTDLDRYRADRDAIVCPEGGPEVWLCLGESTEPLCVDGLCVVY